MLMSFQRAGVVCLLSATFAIAAHGQQQANLAVTKTGPSEANAGANVTYTVTLANLGPNDATSVALNDSIPPGMTFVSATQLSGPSGNCPLPIPGGGGAISCTWATFPAGSSAGFEFVFNIPSSTPPGTTFFNTAAASSATSDPTNANNSETVVTSTTFPPASDLAVTKSGPAQAAAGTNVSYAIGISNIGAADAASASVNDTIPAGMTFVSAVQNTGPTASCSDPGVGNGGTVSCSFSTLPTGSGATFTFTFQIAPATAPGTTFTNVAYVNAETSDTNEENNTAVAVTSTPPPPTGDMGVMKTGPTSAAPDSDVTYTLALTNGGPDAAQNVVLQDNLPAPMTFVSLIQTSGPAMSCGTNTCTAASFPAGATATFQLTGHVPPATTGTITNTATVSSSNDPNDENNSSTTTLEVSSVDVSVTKTAAATVTAGTNLTYTIVWANAGPDTASNVNLSDVLPPGTTFVSFTQNLGSPVPCFTPPPGGTGSIGCSIDFMFPTASFQFTLVVNVGGVATVSNTATATTDSSDVNGSNNSSTAITTVIPSADLSVTKSGPASAIVGTTITYTVNVASAGPSAATSVALNDSVPVGTTFASATQTSGPAFSCSAPPAGGTGTITCTNASFAAGATASFTFTMNVIAAGPIMNTATISAGTGDPVPANNTASTTANSTTLADLSVVKTAPGATAAGANVSFTVVVNNPGPSDASTVLLSDAVPAGSTFVSATQTAGPTFNCTTPVVGGTGTIACTIATMPAGTTASFSFVFIASAAGTMTNIATVSSATTDPNPLNNTSTASTPITPSADLSVTKSGPLAATAGTTITYTVTVANAGPTAATSVALNDAIPAGTTFASLTQTSGPAFSCVAPAPGGTGTITCTIASFAAGATSSFTVTMNVTAGGPITNTAMISAATADPVPANNTASTTTNSTTLADLSVVKTAPGATDQGANVSFTVTVNNAGPSDASTVLLSDTVPAGSTFVSATQTAGPTFNCTTPVVGGTGTIACTIATMPAGTTASFSFVVIASAAGTLTNTATVSAATADPNLANNSSTGSTPIAPVADVSIVKTAPGGAHFATTAMTYTITVTNSGPGNALNTTVTDTLPAGTTFVSATPSQGTCTGTATVTCTLGTLAPSASATIALTVSLPATQGTVSNTATVTTTNTDTNLANNASTATITTQPASAIPTLSHYALMLLAAGLALVAFYRAV